MGVLFLYHLTTFGMRGDYIVHKLNHFTTNTYADRAANDSNTRARVSVGPVSFSIFYSSTQQPFRTSID